MVCSVFGKSVQSKTFTLLHITQYCMKENNPWWSPPAEKCTSCGAPGRMQHTILLRFFAFLVSRFSRIHIVLPCVPLCFHVLLEPHWWHDQHILEYLNCKLLFACQVKDDYQNSVKKNAKDEKSGFSRLWRSKGAKSLLIFWCFTLISMPSQGQV